jgi:drug/metabolite transporter (DMT)-like permease
MRTNRSRAVVALAAAGVAWGASVPLSKVGMGWLGPGWLTTVRFALAALVLLAFADRQNLRAAFRWRVLVWGALGYGGSVLVQNAGLARTSVTHTALIIGAGPVLVALIAALWRHSVARPVAWAGFTLSLAGVGFIAGGHGGGASGFGDALVLGATLLASAMTVAQGDLLAGRDPVAVTAVQFAAAAAVTLPFALVTEGGPAAPAHLAPVLAVLALTVAGTVAPFTLFAYGQKHVSAELAGSFLNLEPLVGAVAGVLFFANPAGPRQLAGGAAIVAGIALSSLPLLPGRGGHGQPPEAVRTTQPIAIPQPSPAH